MNHHCGDDSILRANVTWDPGLPSLGAMGASVSGIGLAGCRFLCAGKYIALLIEHEWGGPQHPAHDGVTVIYLLLYIYNLFISYYICYKTYSIFHLSVAFVITIFVKVKENKFGAFLPLKFQHYIDVLKLMQFLCVKTNMTNRKKIVIGIGNGFGGESNLHPRHPPHEYLGEYTSRGKPKIPPADKILTDPGHNAYEKKGWLWPPAWLCPSWMVGYLCSCPGCAVTRHLEQ